MTTLIMILFTEINHLPLTNKDKIRKYFTNNDEVKAERILFTITEDNERVDYLKTFIETGKLSSHNNLSIRGYTLITLPLTRACR